MAKLAETQALSVASAKPAGLVETTPRKDSEPEPEQPVAAADWRPK